MNALIRAELLKLTTTRTVWGVLLASIALVPGWVALAVLQHAVPLDSREGVRNVMAAASSGTVMLLVLGILMTAGEFRHKTATSTFLITPHRGRVLRAKLVAVAITAMCLTVIVSLAALAVALPWLHARGVQVASYPGEIAAALGGAILAGLVSGLFGVGFGAVVRNQTAALTAALLWSQLVEGLLVSFAPTIGRWLPGGASTALTGTATPNGGLLPMWGAALLFTGYGLAFAFGGLRTVSRQDVA
jgi:ABC-2 type transport system permease protein